MKFKNKISIKALILLLIIPISTSYTTLKHDIKQVMPIRKVRSKKTLVKNKSFKHFLFELSNRESGNDWTSYNKWGYVGKYQFGRLALTDLGYSNCFTLDEFKNNPSVFPEWLQDDLIVKLININEKTLNSYIIKYKDSIIEGIRITESGIIAAAHLVGSTNTIKWLTDSTHKDITDGNNVSIKHYLTLFAGYKIP